MTDPRIEAALEAAWSHTTQHEGGMSFPTYEAKSPDAAGEFKKAIIAALAAADAAAWRPLVKFPPPSNAVLIKSEQGGEKHYAVAKWDLKIDAWRNEDQMYSPRYFTQWQPLGGEIGA